MKIFLLYILLIVNPQYNGMYQSSSVKPKEINSGYGVSADYRIGYSTNYGHGFQKPSTTTYSPSYHSFTTSRYKPMSTYNPATGSGSGKSGPRRITVYNGDGETGQTPGGNSDRSNWLYMQDDEGNWYCSKDGGITWYMWAEKEYGSGIGGWIARLIDEIAGNTEAWSTTPTTPPENSSHWASDPDDPFLTPVGEIPVGLVLFLIILYITKNYERTKVQSRRPSSHFD